MEIILMPIAAGIMFAIISAILKIIFKLLSNGRKTGEIYYPNGNIRGRAELNKYNQLDGEEKIFYENGEIKAIRYWKNNKLNGKYEEFYENGNLESEFPYTNGSINGIVKIFYDNGNIKSRTPVKNDVIWGTVENYYRNGKVKSKVSYKNGILESYNELDEKEKKLDLDSLLNRKNK